ncbi:MAG: response regulator, partial [Bacteroidetes bacterium]|nr:response regulator [Bacteroidota bacterium]
MTPSNPHNEEIRAEANIILKVVDQCIKAGLLEEAKGHLDKARIIDPTNAYIYAFQERIAFLKEESEKKNAAANNRNAMENAVRAKIEEERKRAELERAKKETVQQKKPEPKLPADDIQQKKNDVEERNEELLRDAAERQQKQAAAPPPPPPPKSTGKNVNVPIETQKMVEEIYAQKVTQTPPQNATAKAIQKVAENASNVVESQKSNQANDMYKRVLLLAWADGAVSQEEQSQLRDLRTTLRITNEEHAKLELEAKEESYAHAFTLVWTSGMNVKERSAVVNELRYKYQISPEAHSRIESKVLAEYGEHEDKPMLYVIDDDENTLGMIVRVLEGGGFTVQAYNTSDEALAGLKSDMPALIISDINLETSTIGGFSFYEKVRQLHHLNHIPFIFLSGMTDEGMVRYGKGLGADDYLT